MKLARKIGLSLIFLAVYLKNLVRANIAVAYDIITPKHRMQPGIIRVPLKLETDFSILMLVNLITMTPGTMSLDISSDKTYLYIHAMYLKDKEKVVEEIKEMENRVHKIFES